MLTPRILVTPRSLKIVRMLKESVKIARDKGVTFALENHIDYTSAEILDIFQRVDSDSLKVSFDPGNTLRMNSLDGYASMKLAPILTALLLAPLAMLHAADVPKQKPNILFILADDMGWGDVRGHGNDKIDTPVLDRLQSQGVELDHFYVSPICSPTRSSLLTGRHHFRLRVLSTTGGLEVMHGDEITLAEALKPAGYVSGCFGKWHNGANYPSAARGQGFDEFFGFIGGFFSNYFDPALEHDGVTAVRKGFITDVLAEAALAFIEKHRSQPLDGVSLAPLLRGTVNAWPDRVLFEVTGRGGTDGAPIPKYPGTARSETHRWVHDGKQEMLFRSALGSAGQGVRAVKTRHSRRSRRNAAGQSQGRTGHRDSVRAFEDRDPLDIHPPKKEIPAQRFAAMALAQIYGKQQVAHGPRLELWSPADGNAVLKLSSMGGGLVTKSVNLGGHEVAADKLQGFELAGADRLFFRAEARIQGKDSVQRHDQGQFQILPWNPTRVNGGLGRSMHRSVQNCLVEDIARRL